MNSITSSPKQIEKVSSDNLVIGFDLLSNLTYMAVLAIGGLPRGQVLENCGKQNLKTAVFFRHVYLLANRVGLEYTRAFQLVSQKARASSVKSLLLRFAASISSGESERGFIEQEMKLEAERYGNEYARSVENLRKWTDAYAAILVSVTLIMVVSMVSSMLGSLGENFIVLMAMTLFFITSIGVYVIYKVAPVEPITYDSPLGIPQLRRRSRMFLVYLGPTGLVVASLLAPQFSFMSGASVAFLIVGASLLPAGFFAWKDDSAITKLDTELPVFFRSVGNVAGSTGVTLTRALSGIDTRSMGSLAPHINRLHVRLTSQLPSRECWEKFRGETGSELANRTTHMIVDGVELGGRADDVGNACSSHALQVTQLRASRQLTASTFSFLTVPMHATMTFILVFVLEIVSNFNEKLAGISGELLNSTEGSVNIPSGLSVPSGISIPTGGDMSGGLDIFGSQDMTLIAYMIVLVVIILTVANSLAPKCAAGGNSLKVVSFLSIMCIVSGGILGLVPVLTSKLFSI